MKYFLCSLPFSPLSPPFFLQHGLCSKAHLMGASIRKDMTSSVTHVVAHSVSGSKYKVGLHRVHVHYNHIFNCIHVS